MRMPDPECPNCGAPTKIIDDQAVLCSRCQPTVHNKGGARKPDWGREAIRRAEAMGQKWRPCRYCPVLIIIAPAPLKGGGWSKPKVPLEYEGGDRSGRVMMHDDNCTRKSVPDGFDPARSHRITKKPLHEEQDTRQRVLDHFTRWG